VIGRSEIAHYHPLLSLLCGVLAWGWTAGPGGLLLKGAKLRIEGAMGLAAEFLLGSMIVGMVVQILAWSGFSTGPVMKLLAGILVLAAVAMVPCWIRRAFRTASAVRSRPFDAFALPVWLLALVLLIAAAAPASRSDETGYHFLVGTRLLFDGSLRYYPLPWEATVMPQFAWHYSLVPLIALFGTAPAGILSAICAIVLAYCASDLVTTHAGSARLGSTAALCVLAGGYTISLLTTLGPHAFLVLSTFIAAAAIGWSQELRLRLGLTKWAVLFGVGVAGMLAGKVTMLPLAAVLTCLALSDIAREPRTLRSKWVTAAFVLIFPALVFLPPALADWLATGSPLGIITAAAMGAQKSFDAEAMRTYQSTLDIFSGGFSWRFELAYWNAPILAGCFVALWDSDKTRRLRWWLLGGVQILTIFLLLPKEIRHLSGLQYVLFTAGLIEVARRFKVHEKGDWRIALVATIAALPWAVLTLWIGSIYVPLFLGSMSAEVFLSRYCALEDDYRTLDGVLPSDAKLLIGHSKTDATQAGWYARPSVLYAPRPMLFHTSEVRPDDHVYLMFIGAGAIGQSGLIPFDPWMPVGFRLGKRVYSNAAAHFFPSRTPRAQEGSVAPLDVYELERSP
jgi:hypothetical protein